MDNHAASPNFKTIFKFIPNIGQRWAILKNNEMYLNQWKNKQKAKFIQHDKLKHTRH